MTRCRLNSRSTASILAAFSSPTCASTNAASSDTVNGSAGRATWKGLPPLTVSSTSPSLASGIADTGSHTPSWRSPHGSSVGVDTSTRRTRRFPPMASAMLPSVSSGTGVACAPPRLSNSITCLATALGVSSTPAWRPTNMRVSVAISGANSRASSSGSRRTSAAAAASSAEPDTAPVRARSMPNADSQRSLAISSSPVWRVSSQSGPQHSMRRHTTPPARRLSGRAFVTRSTASEHPMPGLPISPAPWAATSAAVAATRAPVRRRLFSTRSCTVGGPGGGGGGASHRT
mmetsp:Transcript_9838/g.30965  ORF Transcript_9838/g.30965 Transcript_9838/m.30965 type:complete len:289 (-) Transcript_9838:1545-2411(-)